MQKQPQRKKGILIRIDEPLLNRLQNVVEFYGQQSHIIRQAIEEKVSKLEELKIKKAS
jgi:predicted DNA-binding protein